MKFSVNQRKLYMLAVSILLLAVVVCAAWRLVEDANAPNDHVPWSDRTGTPSPIPTGDTNAAPAAPTSEQTARADTVVYYQDNEGYLVPVMRRIVAETGIAKATLAMMVSNPYNDMEAARLGLRTVLPEGTNVDLDIANEVARIDLSGEVLAMADAAAENTMVTAVVQTLTEFPTVKRVQFLIEGQARKTLTHGTPVSGDFTRGLINLESVSAMGDAMRAVQLYFPGDASSLIVPVTRMVYGAADINTAVLELVKGPSGSSPLMNALPSGCGLIDVSVNQGIATIDFTQEFIHIAEQSDGGRLALKALVLTCTQFDGVKGVQVKVEGKPYDPGEGTLAVPTWVNSATEVAEQFIQTQSNLLFEFE